MRIRLVPRPARLAALAAVALAAAPTLVRADVFTFVGTYNSLWDFQPFPGFYGNWLDGRFPTWSALYDDEIHLGSGIVTGRLASNMDLSSARLGRLVFDQKDGVDLTGNALRFGGGGTIAVASAADHTMANDVVLNDNGVATNTLTVNIVTNANLAANGVWSGSGSLVKTGEGTLTLSGNNAYNGGTTIRGGAIKAGANGALGGGDLTLVGGDLNLDGYSPTVRNLTFGDGATAGSLGTVSGSGTLNVTGDVDFRFLSGHNESVTLGAKLALSAGQHAISSDTYSNFDSFNIVLSGGISGEGGIDVSGDPFFVVLASKNTYAGATNLNGGYTLLGVEGALPSTTALTVKSGANLSFYTGGTVPSYSQTVGSLAGGGHIELGFATLTVGGLNTDTEFSGDIYGSLVKTGTGTLTFSGENVYVPATIRGGAIKAGSDFALGGGYGYRAYNSLTLAGGDLDLNGFSPTVVDLNLGDGATSGNLGTVRGSGTLNLTGNVAFRPVNFASSPAVLTADLVLSGGQHVFSSTGYSTGSYYDEILAGTLSGAGGIDKAGPAFLALDATNSYAGATNVIDGAILTTAVGALPASTALTVDARGGPYNSGLYLSTAGNESGVVAGNYSQTVGSLAGKGSVYLGSATLTVGTLNTDTAFSGVITDADGGFTINTGGKFVKVGTGSLTLSGANAYTGGTTVGGGRLVVTQPNGRYATNAMLEFSLPTDFAYAAPITGTGTFVKSGAGTLTFSDTNTYAGGTTVSGGRLVEQNPHGTYVDHGVLEFANASDVSVGKISGTGSLVKSGAGTLTFSDTNTYAGGTTVSSGRLIESNPHGDYVTSAILEFATAGDYTYRGAISGAGSLVKSGSGILALDGSVASGVSVGISGGTLKASANGFQGNVASTGGTLQFDQTKAGTYEGTYSGAGALLKTGSRALTMANAPANTGGVHLAGGTLVVDGAGSFDGGFASDRGTTFLNSSDGTLTIGGRSYVQGVVDTTEGSKTVFTGLVSGAGRFGDYGTVEFDGGYSPGNSPASVTFQGDLVLGAANDLTMELGKMGYDHLSVYGSAFLSGKLDVVWYDAFRASQAGEGFNLFEWRGDVSGTFSMITLPTLGNGLIWDTSTLYTDGTIRVQSVPEPASLAALGLIALATLRRRRV